MRVLLVEDSRDMRRLLKRMLELFGHEVTVAANGREAWELFQQDPTRIVITEWSMPDMDGLELCLQIRGMNAPCYTYVIVMTAHAEPEYVAQALAAGADDFIAKPINRTELRWRLQSGLRILHLEDNLDKRIREVNLANKRLAQANARMQTGLAAAAKAQRALLPTTPPKSEGAECGWVYESCDELGGDSLNFFSFRRNKIGFYVADVSGHGVEAALLAVTLHRTLAPVPGQLSLLTHQDDMDDQPLGLRPAALLDALNKRFPMDLKTGQYFTMVYGYIDISSGRVRYATAGHPGPVLVAGSGKTTLLTGGGLPVGFMDDAAFEEHTVELEPGDRLCLYSDGISEAPDPAGAQFGEQHLQQALVETRHKPVDEALQFVVSRIKEWSAGNDLKDDLSAIDLEYIGSLPGVEASPAESSRTDRESAALV